jgi:tetratricopeptide (TPR) repeat protein
MCSLIFCATLVAYFPALRGGLIWDDAAHVTRSDLQSLHGLQRIWCDVGATQQYYPFLHSAFWIEHRLWGDAPLGYHLLNILLHATAACLLGLVLRRLFHGAVDPSPPPGTSISGSGAASQERRMPAGVEWLAALLFALHPVDVESVAWISEQKNTLSAVFYLGSALAYLRFRLDHRRSQYCLALGLFVLALLTKTVTATLPAALLVVFWWQRGRLAWRRDVFPLLPWFALGVTGGLFTAWVERLLIGAQGADFTLTLPDRCLLAGRVVWFYLGKVVWPTDLIFIYPRWTIDAAVWWQYLFPAGVLALAAGLWCLARRHRGPLAGFLFFAGTLFPAMGFFNVYPFVFSYVADHFQYLASLGVLVPAAVGLVRAAGLLQVSHAAARRWSVRAAGGLLLVTLGTLTWRQCGIYRDARTLYSDTLARNPDCAMAHTGLGDILANMPGRLPDAIAHFEAAIRINPRDAQAHNNLGYALAKDPGRLPEAVAEYKAALRIIPEFAWAHNNLGVALERIPGRLPEAIAHFEEAVELDPDSADLQDNLGVALTRVPGRAAEAIAHFEAAVLINPGSADMQNNLAVALAEAPGRLAEATAHFEAAARINPHSAEIQNNLGAVLANTPGRLPDAIAHFEAAVRLDPGSAKAHDNLGNALALVPGKLPEAIQQLEAAVRLDPGSAQAHHDLGKFLLRVPGRLPEAIGHFEVALRIDSNSAETHNDLGVALLQAPGRTPEAIEHLEAAIRINPELVEAHYVLGIALSTFPDRKEEARVQMEAALKIKPDFQPAQEWMEQLRASQP